MHPPTKASKMPPPRLGPRFRVCECLSWQTSPFVIPSVVEGSGRTRRGRRVRCQMSRLRFAPLDTTIEGPPRDLAAHACDGCEIGFVLHDRPSPPSEQTPQIGFVLHDRSSATSQGRPCPLSARQEKLALFLAGAQSASFLHNPLSEWQLAATCLPPNGMVQVRIVQGNTCLTPSGQQKAIKPCCVSSYESVHSVWLSQSVTRS